MHGPVASLYLWRLPRRRLPATLPRASAQVARLRRRHGVRFAKLLGTASGETFSPWSADLTRWALFTVCDDVGAARRCEELGPVPVWDVASDECWRVHLLPQRWRGRWGGREPLGRAGSPPPPPDGEPVAALTRARLRPAALVPFHRAVPRVAAALRAHPGVLLSLAVGEVPLVMQGTFSVWDGERSLRRFAYASPEHGVAVRRTGEEGWYAEEFFARFRVLRAEGSIDGRDPLRAVGRTGRADQE